MDLEEIRQNINRVDAQMKDLFLERMEYSAQVAGVKKQTGGSVFVPGREKEILRLRLQGVSEEYALECRAFFRQMIGISRTYQYTKLAEGEERLSALPEGNGKAVLEFSCRADSGMLATVFQAAALAGLLVEETAADRGPEEMLHVTLGLAGDFSKLPARAAVLQILEETEEAVLFPV